MRAMAMPAVSDPSRITSRQWRGTALYGELASFSLLQFRKSKAQPLQRQFGVMGPGVPL